MFNTIVCNTKENKSTSTLCSFVLNFILWSGCYSREVLSTIPQSRSLVLVRCCHCNQPARHDEPLVERRHQQGVLTQLCTCSCKVAHTDTYWRKIEPKFFQNSWKNLRNIFKWTMTRDCPLQVFFMNHFLPVPWVSHIGFFKFLQKFSYHNPFELISHFGSFDLFILCLKFKHSFGPQFVRNG